MKKEAIDKKSERKAFRRVLLGSTILVGQFTFITTGTFIYFSWGIMEPIAYTMLLSNFVFGFFFINMRKESFAPDSIQKMLAERYS